MGRELKRVALNYVFEPDTVWEGYAPSLEKLKSISAIVTQVPEILNYQDNVCRDCDKTFNDCSESARHCIWYNEDLKNLWYYDPPLGNGYQLWETTSEGSPISPVFKTLEELCEWCEEHATTFGTFQTTKEKWMRMLSDGNVSHTEGNMTFM